MADHFTCTYSWSYPKDGITHHCHKWAFLKSRFRPGVGWERLCWMHRVKHALIGD